MRARKWLAAVSTPLVGAGAILAGLVATAGVASAHTSNISGSAACDSTTGTWTVTWTGHTDQVPSHDIAKVTTTAHSPAASTVPATVTSTLAPNADYSFTQTGVVGNSASVTVHVAWTPDPAKSGNNGQNSDTFSADASGQVGIEGHCNKTIVIPTAPSPNPPTCQADGSVTRPADTASVHWTSTHTGLHYTLVATAQSGFVFTDGHTTETFTVDALPKDNNLCDAVTLVTPAASAASCDGLTSIPSHFVKPDNTADVTYTMNGSGLVTATISSNHKFGTLPSGWTKTSVTTATFQETLGSSLTCTVQNPSISVTGTCNSVTYTFGNVTVTASPSPSQTQNNELKANTAVVPGSITYYVYKNGVLVDTVVVAPGGTGSSTQFGAGDYYVTSSVNEAHQDGFTVSGNCVVIVTVTPTPTPSNTPTPSPSSTPTPVVVSPSPSKTPTGGGSDGGQQLPGGGNGGSPFGLAIFALVGAIGVAGVGASYRRHAKQRS